jgi:hypothetical protein
MQLRDQAPPLTLARRLGDVTHVSPLLHRLSRRTGLELDDLGQWLLKCAIARGARHYRREFPPHLPPDEKSLTDEEIGVALCLGHHSYNAQLIRAAAQLLSSPRIDAQKLARLAVLERCEPVLLHIAAACERFDVNGQPWAFLRARLPGRKVPSTDALPHWSRFVSMTGFTPAGRGLHSQWLERHEQPVADPAHSR